MKHALIIEDDYFASRAMGDLLRGHGFRSFDYASTQKNAVDVAYQRQPDLMTVDLYLLQGRGEMAAEQICRALGDIPTIFMTALDQRFAVKPHQRYLVKPIIDKSFGAAVASLGLTN